MRPKPYFSDEFSIVSGQLQSNHQARHRDNVNYLGRSGNFQHCLSETVHVHTLHGPFPKIKNLNNSEMDSVYIINYEESIHTLR